MGRRWLVYMKVFRYLDNLRSFKGRVGIVQPGGIGNSTFVLFPAFGGLYPCEWIYGLCYLV